MQNRFLPGNPHGEWLNKVSGKQLVRNRARRYAPVPGTRRPLIVRKLAFHAFSQPQKPSVLPLNMANSSHKRCNCKDPKHSHCHNPEITPVIGDLKVEYKTNPLGMDEARPRFGYLLYGVKEQTARQLQVVPEGAKTAAWDSGWVEDGRSQQIAYEGEPLKPFTRYSWRVRVKDDEGKATAWSPEGSFFETGFLDGDWTSSHWIGWWKGPRVSPAPQLFCRDFELPKGKKLASARLYATALGCYEAELNGTVVSWPLAPGWTSYNARTQYQAYDVTKLIKTKGNTLWLTLASGWFDGRINTQWSAGKCVFGENEAIRAELRLTFTDGTSQTIGTDNSFTACIWGGPVRMSDIYDGEYYQAWRSKELARKLCSDPAVNLDDIHVRIDWTSGAPVARLQTREPVSITRRCPGTYLVDFGQNFSGREVLHLKDTVKGAVITVQHGETLDTDGSLYTANLRGAKALTTYVCDDAKEAVYEPAFTFYGFRYLEISGWFGKAPTPKDIQAVVLSSDLARTGLFACDNPLVERLFENVGWGLRSNLLDVPTDCPQRDERYGWTGDTQVAANTATYCLDAPAFYTKWLVDLNLDQLPSGLYPFISPNAQGTANLNSPSPAWQDAAFLVPWQLYRKYGDTRVMEKHFDQMDKYLQYEVEYSRGTYVPDPPTFGDWLNVNAPTSNCFLATAYLAGMFALMEKIAGVIGRTKDQARLHKQALKAKKAFQGRFLDPETGLKEKTQCACLLALHFDLLPAKWIRPTVDALVEDIRDTKKLHLSTGFVGTPLLLPVLTRFGHADLAYQLLCQTTYPGWLYPVTQGATTMWERWNSYTKKDGFGDMNMNSFNHYAYGAVAEWFFETIAGIQPLEDDPNTVAFKRFRLAPQPGKALDNAFAAFHSPYGVITSLWQRTKKKNESHLEWSFSVPDNTTAQIVLPPGELLDFSGDEELRHDDYGNLLAVPGEYTLVFRE